MRPRHTATGRRRTLLGLAATGLSLAAIGTARGQEAWPNKPVKIVYPYAPGGAGDPLSRAWADRLTRAYNVPFIVENHGGASGTIGAEAVARAAPDGYTILFTPNSALNVLPQLRKVGYDPRKDFLPVSRLGDLVSGFCIQSALGVSTMAEMIVYAKTNPGKLIYGSAGLGTSSQLRIELIKLRAKVDIVHAPYRGSGDALIDLLAGHINMMNEIVTYPHVKSGKLKLLSVSHPTRHWDFPATPTLTEAGFPNADVPIWFAVWAPAGTPPAIISTLSRKMAEIGATPEMITKMQELGFAPMLRGPEETGAFLASDWDDNATLIGEAKVNLG